MKTLETERLILRNFTKTDQDDLYDYAKVDGVGEMAGWPHHTNIETTRIILDDFISQGDVYAIVLKENNKVIGSVGLHDRPRNNEEFKNKLQREIGYVLNEDYWGKGIVPEAVKAVIKYAFEQLNVEILFCSHFDFNERSKRVIEKCEFKYFCDEIHEATLLNKTFNKKTYSLTKNDYIKAKELL